MATHLKGKTIKTIVEAFESAGCGYKVKYAVLNSANYGVAQERRRIVIVGIRSDIDSEFSYPEKLEKIYTIKDVIDDLPKLKSGETSDIPNHIAMKHSAQMLEKMRYVKDGGNRMDIPEELRPKSGDIRKYIRYDSTKPSVCVTGDMRKIFHYEQNRALTARELARIQSFPDDFIFEGTSIQIQQQIGNAVPPKLAYKIAKQIEEALDNGKVSKGKLYRKQNEKLVNWVIDEMPVKEGVVLDIFAGGCSVSYALKEAGYSVISNDILYADYVIAKALIENNNKTLPIICF